MKRKGQPEEPGSGWERGATGGSGEPGRLECHTPGDAQAAINLKSSREAGACSIWRQDSMLLLPRGAESSGLLAPQSTLLGATQPRRL